MSHKALHKWLCALSELRMFFIFVLIFSKKSGGGGEKQALTTIRSAPSAV